MEYQVIRHKMLIHCWYNVGLAFQTLVEQLISDGNIVHGSTLGILHGLKPTKSKHFFVRKYLKQYYLKFGPSADTRSM